MQIIAGTSSDEYESLDSRDNFQVTRSNNCAMIEKPLTQGGPMKRLLLVIPLILLLLINACANYPAGVSPADGTAVGKTQTATVWTPTISPTPPPDQSKIVEWLNSELSDTDSLEQALVARYRIFDVSFPIGSNGLATIMRIDIRCECSTYGQCCFPEHMFVAVINSMKKREDKIIEQVPQTVGEMRVYCFDHMTQMTALSASWSDVKSYLKGQINGDQFGYRVKRNP